MPSQVIAVGKSSDLIMMVLEASKGEDQKRKLTNELEQVGIRLNRNSPDVNFLITKGGGLRINSTCKLSNVSKHLTILSANIIIIIIINDQIDMVQIRNILGEYKIHHADVLIKEDITVIILSLFFEKVLFIFKG